MDKFVELAKKTVEEYTKNKKNIRVPGNLPQDFFDLRAGVFVTIRKSKELRGCVGTYFPNRKNIAEEIISNAIAACAQDNRFFPVAEDELPDLSYEVSILSEPKTLKNAAGHDPKKHGVIVRCTDGRCGLLLPDLDGIDSAQEQLSIACQKGRIDPKKDVVEIYFFTVEKHI
jgi:AmmeMemoRadiSam system protein A